jgi:hypothetical protein
MLVRLENQAVLGAESVSGYYMPTMSGELSGGLRLIHLLLFIVGAVAFFIFWVRTRFWLPKYAHAQHPAPRSPSGINA